MNTDFEAKLKSVIEGVHPDARKRTEQDIHALIHQGVRSVDDLIAFVSDEAIDINTRETICWLLSRLDYEQSVEALLNIINNKNPTLRRASIQALGEINVPREQVIKPLIERLQDQDMEVRKVAAYALGQIRGKKATPILLSVLEDQNESPEVRAIVAEALSKINDKDAVIPLISALRDPFAEVRFWAAFALGQLGASQALSELERLVAEDHDKIPGWHSVSQEAAEAIKAIRDTE